MARQTDCHLWEGGVDRTVANCGKTVAKLWQNYNPDTVFVGEMKGNVHANWLLIATTNSGVPEPKAFRKEWTHRAP